MVLLHLHCPSGASLRYAVCHTSCSSYGIRHGSYCVLHATSFISSFVPLHYTTFAAKPFCCKAGHPRPHTKQYTWVCTCLSANHPYNTHWVSFRFTTSFIHFSSVQSTRCQFLLCSPAAPLRLRSPCSCTAHSLRPFRLQLLRFTCIVQPPSYPSGNLLRRLPM